MSDGIIPRVETFGTRQADPGARPRPVRAPRHRCPYMLRGWYFSNHARRHIDARGFDPRDVVAACEAAEMSMTASNYGPDRWKYFRGNLVAIASPVTRTVITVLLRSHDEWDDEDAREANRAGS